MRRADVNQMLRDLRKERERIDTVIDYITKYHIAKTVAHKRKRVLKHVSKHNAATRRKMSIAAKKRWASGVYDKKGMDKKAS